TSELADNVLEMGKSDYVVIGRGVLEDPRDLDASGVGAADAGELHDFPAHPDASDDLARTLCESEKSVDDVDGLIGDQKLAREVAKAEAIIGNVEGLGDRTDAV